MSILAIIALVLASMQDGPALAGARSPRRLTGPATQTRGAILLAGQRAAPGACRAPGPTLNGGLFTGIAALSDDDVWIVGAAGNDAGKTLVGHWDGTRWSAVPSANPPAPYSTLSAVAAISRNDVWAVGTTRSGGGGALFVEHWDGRRWSIVPTPHLSVIDARPTGLAAISADDVWLVGTQVTKGGRHATLAEHWDGTRWSVIPTCDPGQFGHELNAVVVVSSRDVWAVGTTIGWKRGTLIEHWDGRSWRIVPSPTLQGGDNALYGIVMLWPWMSARAASPSPGPGWAPAT
jgi:hypothetical protein